jgi:hypothetical protein
MMVNVELCNYSIPGVEDILAIFQKRLVRKKHENKVIPSHVRSFSTSGLLLLGHLL